MVPITIEKFVDQYMKGNPIENRKEIINSLKAALAAKEAGASCSQCGEQIWAVGTGIVGWSGCFTCITGETDDSNDYEIM